MEGFVERNGTGNGTVLVAPFAVEPRGLRATNSEELPGMLHLNPRLCGDWSGRPVLAMNECGAVELTHQEFDRMPERDLVSWNAMVLALANHGRVQDSFDLFDRMTRVEIVVPNAITFVAVLSACNHGGLVDEGRKYFGDFSGITSFTSHLATCVGVDWQLWSVLIPLEIFHVCGLMRPMPWPSFTSSVNYCMNLDARFVWKPPWSLQRYPIASITLHELLTWLHISTISVNNLLAQTGLAATRALVCVRACRGQLLFYCNHRYLVTVIVHDGWMITWPSFTWRLHDVLYGISHGGVQPLVTPITRAVDEVCNLFTDEEGSAPEEPPIEDHTGQLFMSVSYSAWSGTASHQTLKLKGSIQQQFLNILLDSGNTHTIVNDKLIPLLSGVQSSSYPPKVQVANGTSVSGRYQWLQAHWQIQEYEFVTDIGTGFGLWSSGASDKNKSMVEQLPRYGVFRLTKVAEVMEAIDRGLFVPLGRSPYHDSPMLIGYNATISAPHMHAACLELLEKNHQPGMQVFNVGSGIGVAAGLVTSGRGAITSGQGNFAVFVWDPGGHAKYSLGTSCISSGGECQQL